jgi:hypothetical protein
MPWKEILGEASGGAAVAIVPGCLFANTGAEKIALAAEPLRGRFEERRVASGAAFQNLFQVALPVQNGYHLHWDCFRAIDDHVVRKSRDGPEAYR